MEPLDKLPETMNSIVLTKRGAYDFGKMPVPKPTAGNVLIKVEACGLNPSDL